MSASREDAKQGTPITLRTVLERNGHLVFRAPAGLMERGGQLHFDFDEPPPEAAASLGNQAFAAGDWYGYGRDCEAEGQLNEAAKAYRQALLLGGPDADICYNLANVLNALGQKEPAVERYRQVIELDAGYVEAWNNLGTVLEGLGQTEEALAAYRQAVVCCPIYADAHYNLADLLSQTGKNRDARPHWEAYLRHDGQGRWGDYAREQLKKA